MIIIRWANIVSVLKKLVLFIFGNRVIYFGSSKGFNLLNFNSWVGIGFYIV